MDRNATTRRGIGGEAAEMLRKNIRNYAMYTALAVIFIVFQILSRGAFLTARNITNLINQTGYIAVMAVGMTLFLNAARVTSFIRRISTQASISSRRKTGTSASLGRTVPSARRSTSPAFSPEGIFICSSA